MFRRKLLIISPSLHESVRGWVAEGRKDIPLPNHQLSEGVAQVVSQPRLAIRVRDVDEWVRKCGSRRPRDSYSEAQSGLTRYQV